MKTHLTLPIAKAMGPLPLPPDGRANARACRAGASQTRQGGKGWGGVGGATA